MSRVLIAVIGLVIGIAIGAVGAMTFGGGVLAGVGVGTGLATGICATVRAAQKEGVMTADQVDRVLNRAAKDFAAEAGMPAGQAGVGSAAACEKVFAHLGAAK